MYYYFVWVRSNRYHGQEALTYSSSQRLSVGSIVQVELQKEVVQGLVIALTTKPRFKTKTISRIYDLPPLPSSLIKLGQWLRVYYPAPLGIVAQQFLPAHFADKQLATPPPEKFPAPSTKDLPPLSSDQSAALTAMASADTYLVHGQTGSGKTRLYVELALRSIAAQHSAIVLTPEISLTSQLATSFRAVFGSRVIVLHSQQSPSERQKAWLDSLRASEPVIIIGPRSALFSPVSKPGVIVLDESHEAAYKQEQSPQYHAGRVAAYLAQLNKATLVLGSATPAITDYYLAQQKHKAIVQLSRLAPRQQLAATAISLVDLKDRTQFNRSPYISQALITAINDGLGRGEQALLYLNRRGTARLVLCENCGWQANCPHCDLPLTYHSDHYQLRCHSCDYHQVVPGSCPTCSYPAILFKTAGTKAIVDDVTRLFPNAKLGRFDTDNLRAERFEQQYEAVRRGEIDILIGTQLLAKGLDLPKLSTVGVLIADTSLYLPDFTAQERTFQLVSQVLGRIGRGHVAGRAIIQSYNPEHPVLQEAINNNYLTFYKRELAERQQFLFPPFCYLLKLTCRRATAKSAAQAAEKLKQTILAARLGLRVEGPAPAFHERYQSKYQWQIVVKATNRSVLLQIVADLPANCFYDLDPIDLL